IGTNLEHGRVIYILRSLGCLQWVAKYHSMVAIATPPMKMVIRLFIVFPLSDTHGAITPYYGGIQQILPMLVAYDPTHRVFVRFLCRMFYPQAARGAGYCP